MQRSPQNLNIRRRDELADHGEEGKAYSTRVDFNDLHLNVTRSLVDQHVGPVKTEVSRKLMPIDEYVAHDLLAWYELTPYKKPSGVWGRAAMIQ